MSFGYFGLLSPSTLRMSWAGIYRLVEWKDSTDRGETRRAPGQMGGGRCAGALAATCEVIHAPW